MREDKWLRGGGAPLNKWPPSLFAQSFLHNKAQTGDAGSILKSSQLYLYRQTWHLEALLC